MRLAFHHFQQELQVLVANNANECIYQRPGQIYTDETESTKKGEKTRSRKGPEGPAPEIIWKHILRHHHLPFRHQQHLLLTQQIKNIQTLLFK